MAGEYSWCTEPSATLYPLYRSPFSAECLEARCLEHRVDIVQRIEKKKPLRWEVDEEGGTRRHGGETRSTARRSALEISLNATPKVRTPRFRV
jgi:hypothetical protein